MGDEINIETFIKRFDNGDFKKNDLETQCDAGWYDWFCEDHILALKTEILGDKLKQIINSKKINQKTMYVFFKNNCPIEGDLYDDFRICDNKTGNVIYTVVPKNGHKYQKGLSEVWGKENEFEKPLVEGTWEDVKEFFLN